jgi:hypothetical protein
MRKVGERGSLHFPDNAWIAKQKFNMAMYGERIYKDIHVLRVSENTQSIQSAEEN